LIKDFEQALIQKAIEEKEIYKLLNVDIGKCLYLNSDIWDFVSEYNSRYKQAPPIDVVKNKFPEFEHQDIDDVSLEFLLDELNEQAHPEQVDIVLNQYQFHYWNSAEKKGYSGTMIFSKIEPLSVLKGMKNNPDNEGRVLTLEFKDFYLVNVYTPNSGRGLKRLNFRKELTL